MTVLLVFTSCKKCDPTNSTGGEVIENAVVRYTPNIFGPLLITNASQLPYSIEVSFDELNDYQPVNFNQYSALAIPTSASCSSGYDRVVTVNDANQTVTYTITITECETCEGTANIQNWVLIPAVPSNYQPIFKVNQ
jgi:hypothetical protein